MTSPAMSTVEFGISKKNAEGYLDPTSFKALQSVQRTEFGYRPLVYICSPYSGDVESNVELARDFSAFAVGQRVIPLTPHLLYPQFLNDDDPDECELAMFFNRILLTKCEEMWVYTGHVSHGMRAEIDWARELELPIHYFNADFQEVTF